MARPAKFSDDVLLTRALAVFREMGYAGASLSKLSEATGLKRASLYHRFPGGKEEIAVETVAALRRWVEAQIITPLKTPGTAQARLEAAAEAFALLYDHGKEACLINLFGSTGTTPSAVVEAVQALLSSIIGAISTLLEEAGVPGDVARARATTAIATIEGAVVLARSYRDTAPFDAAMATWVDGLMPPISPPEAESVAPTRSRAPHVPRPEDPAPKTEKTPPTDDIRRTVARHLALMRQG